MNKDNNNMIKSFTRFADFSDYLVESMTADLTKVGEGHSFVNHATESRIIKLFQKFTSSVNGENGRQFCFADTNFSIRVWNGLSYERLSHRQFAMLIQKVMETIDVGIVYEYKSSGIIASKIINNLIYNGIIWSPSNRYMVFQNGVLDTEDMVLYPHSPEYMTNIVFADLDFNPDADCPIFKKVVNDALDKDTANVLQEMCGYLLFPDSRHEKIGVLVGNGCNGKSVIINAIGYALGEDNVTHYSLPQITSSSGVYMANMVGKLANLCHDSGNLIKVGNEGLFKQYASGEPMAVKLLYHQPFTTADYPHSIVAVNELPPTKDFSDGFFRRFLIINFPRQIPASEIDTQLFAKMKPERMGILLWIINGLNRLCNQGEFSHSDAVSDVAARYEKTNDTVAMFIRKHNIRPSYTEQVRLEVIYQMYIKWAEDKDVYRITKRLFSKKLKELGFSVIKSNWMKVYAVI